MARFKPLIRGSSFAGVQIFKSTEAGDDPVADLPLIVAIERVAIFPSQDSPET
jgi:hypothetical protein